jgi:hypothetical protein
MADSALSWTDADESLHTHTGKITLAGVQRPRSPLRPSGHSVEGQSKRRILLQAALEKKAVGVGLTEIGTEL